MNLCFCLPGPALIPIGGYKIVYEYANRLSELGFQVTLVYDCRDALSRYKFPKMIEMALCHYRVTTGPQWFQLSKAVKQRAVFNVTDDSIPDFDVIVATAVSTAPIIHDLSPKKGRKFYLIQHFENWDHSDEAVYQSYRFGMTNIVIARWLQEIVDQTSGVDSVYIPNGLDFEVFNVDVPIEQRDKPSISMLFHLTEWKGAKDGLAVLDRLKETYPELEARVFGVPSRPETLPSWIEYIQKADQKQLRDLYNQSAVYLCPSWSEGFGLTGAESMACGCALVSTACQGVLEYATDEKTALLSPPKDIEALYQNVVRLFEDKPLRIKIAQAGNRSIKSLAWSTAVKKLATAFEERGRA
ncbi:MAG TPA: glycosyltransferase family 4 protein [Desulfosporosinus sp.]|nr:glycosyltransferase family 4 protein [Desulfosporosinus sp.]